MTESEYRALAGVNVSTLKEMRKSPAHYAHRLKNPREDDSGLAMGRLNHSLIFEPDRVSEGYAIFQGKTRRGKEWDAFEAEHLAAGRTIVKENELRSCLSLRDAVLANPLVRRLMAEGESEKCLTWTDADTGLRCKGRLDRLVSRVLDGDPPLPPRAILDLKGVPSVNPRIYGAMAARQGHHIQACHYVRGALANGLGRLPFFVIAVEIEPPHDIGIFEVGDDAMYAAEEEYRDLMKRVVECSESGRWPGRFDAIQPLELPGWAFPEDESDPFAALPVAAEG